MKFLEHEGKEISEPEAIANIIIAIVNSFDEIDKEKEHFFGIGLDARNKIKYVEVVSVGTINASLVHPRELFRRAVISGVSSIMIAHNHPSGEVDPSDADISVTKRILDAGKIMGIELLDHIIVGGKKHYSFRSSGRI